jgi:hypothetical protein
VDTLLNHSIDGYFCALSRKHPILQNAHIRPYKTIILWFKMAHLSLDKRAISNKMGFHNLGA